MFHLLRHQLRWFGDSQVGVSTSLPDSTYVCNVAEIMCRKAVDLYSFVVRYTYAGVVLVERHVEYVGRWGVVQRHCCATVEPQEAP